jgi:hypothetical protein
MMPSVQIWRSIRPQEDVAWGAACWSEVDIRYEDVLQLRIAPTSIAPGPVSVKPDEQASQQELKKESGHRSDMPPWERD